jgi:predicted transcriptional regulator of viral defense system/very-short-patch-repair endonuclease
MDVGPAARILGAPPLPSSPDQLLAVAAEQHGLVTRPQCLAAGLTDKVIRWRLERGWWVVVHHGVYLTEPGRNDWYTRAIGAQLAVQDSAWSHHTAGFVHGLLRRPPSTIELVVDAERHVTSPPGVIVRRRRSVNRSVDDLHWPWRTTAAETLLDLADAGTADELFAIMGRAFQGRLTSEAELRRALALRRAHRWSTLLDAVLVDVADGAESTMEVRYVRDVERAHGLPSGRRQLAAPDGGRERHDVAYEEQRVLVELDGRLGHEGREERIRDGRRDRRGATVGWLTVRGFWTDVVVTPCAFATDVGAVLGTRGWRGRPRRCRRRSCPVGR